MPIRPEINGKRADVSKVYVYPNGTAKRVNRVYLENGGKLSLYWQRLGGKGRPYTISSGEDLKKIADDPGGCYLLTKDLTIYDTGLFPLLPPNVPFTGVLDGNGHKITGASVSTIGAHMSDDGYIGGLFAVNRGIITRLNLDLGKWTVHPIGSGDTPGYMGGIAGLNEGTIDQVIWNFNQVNTGGNFHTGAWTGRNTGVIQNISKRYKTSFAAAAGCHTGEVAALNEGVIQLAAIADTGIVYENSEGGLISKSYCYYTSFRTNSKYPEFAYVKTGTGKTESLGTPQDYRYFTPEDFPELWAAGGWKFLTENYKGNSQPVPDFSKVIY